MGRMSYSLGIVVTCIFLVLSFSLAWEGGV
jgi:hypothetical protein